MCGIAGFLGNLKSPIKHIMGDVLRHRGPDDSGSLDLPEQGIHLFHQRLSILDVSQAGHQPMQSSDGRVAIVYNGEIYNFNELRSQLEQVGYHFSSQSDTEVVLNAYHAWGEDFLQKLNGIFSFALWDADRQSTLLARDPLGVKPLYYSEFEGKFAFASEIKGLIKLMPEIRELDQQALRSYFSFIYCPGERTPFKSVRKLDPGSAMWISGGKPVFCWSYYRLPALDPFDESMTQNEAITGTYEALGEAVRRQMIADVPLGAFLSGGIDSTAIVSFARKISPDIRCFTIRTSGGRDAGETDDLPYAKMAAEHLGVSLDIVDVEASQIPQDIEKMIWHLDEPIADPASLNTYYIADLARQNGMKVLLSGTGGDDLFSGYRRHHALSINHYLNKLPGPIKQTLLRLLKVTPAKSGLARRRDKLVQIMDNAEHAGLVAYFLWGLKDDLDNLFLDKCEYADDAIMNAYLDHADPTASPLQKMLALEQRFFLADHNLNYADKMGMAASVEIRVPFLDLDLVNFASRIPDKYRVTGQHSKWVLKQAMKRSLPNQILTRPKTGFGVPIRQWMRHDLKDFMQDTLNETKFRNRGIFNPAFVQQLIRENNSGGRDAAFTLFSLLCVEIWCQKFLDQNNPTC